MPPHDQRWLWKLANGLAIAILCALASYYLTGFQFDTLLTIQSRQADFGIYYLIPPRILRYLQYPLQSGDKLSPFPYLPSAVVMMWPLSIPPRPVAFGLWIASQAMAFAIGLWAGMRMSGAAAF